jgi:phage protein U
MLYQLGALTLDVTPFNTHAVERESGYDFAAKEIVGAMKPREPMGEADEKITFECRLFPHRFGGLSELSVLDSMRASGQPQILVRGDGLNRGWFVIERVREKESYLTAEGIGRQIEVTIELARSPKGANASSILSTLMSLFG